MPSAGLPRSPPQPASGDFGPGRPPPASVPMPSDLPSTLSPSDTYMDRLLEIRLAQLASVDQQRELMTYMRGLNEWLGRDVHDRQSELRGISARVDRLRDDFSRLGLGDPLPGMSSGAKGGVPTSGNAYPPGFVPQGVSSNRGRRRSLMSYDGDGVFGNDVDLHRHRHRPRLGSRSRSPRSSSRDIIGSSRSYTSSIATGVPLKHVRFLTPGGEERPNTSRPRGAHWRDADSTTRFSSRGNRPSHGILTTPSTYTSGVRKRNRSSISATDSRSNLEWRSDGAYSETHAAYSSGSSYTFPYEVASTSISGVRRKKARSSSLEGTQFAHLNPESVRGTGSSHGVPEVQFAIPKESQPQPQPQSAITPYINRTSIPLPSPTDYPSFSRHAGPGSYIYRAQEGPFEPPRPAAPHPSTSGPQTPEHETDPPLPSIAIGDQIATATDELAQRQNTIPVQFASLLDSFIGFVMWECVRLNIISIVILSVISVMSRIRNPGGNAPTGAAMILAFICLLTNALFGGINFVQFGWMKCIRTHQEANLTVDAMTILNKSVWWNILPLLGMPVILLSWSFFLFAVNTQLHIWHTDSFLSSPIFATAISLGFTSLFLPMLIIYLGRKWKQNIDSWMADFKQRTDSSGRPISSDRGPRTNESSVIDSTFEDQFAPAPDHPDWMIHAIAPDSELNSADPNFRAIPISGNITTPPDGTGEAISASNYNWVTLAPLLYPPPAFSRPRSRFVSYGHFDTARVVDLRFLALGTRHGMLFVLEDHDVSKEEWAIFMNHLSLVWSGRFPVTGLRTHCNLRERVPIAVDLVNTWNKKYFLKRKVEAVLCMEQQKTPSSQTVHFVLYLTSPVRSRSKRNRWSRARLPPALAWADCIPGRVCNVVPLTGQYMLRGQLLDVHIKSASVESFTDASIMNSEVTLPLPRRRRANSV